jgi:hypothetical protein
VSDNNINTKLGPDGPFRVHNRVLVWCRAQNWNAKLEVCIVLRTLSSSGM